MTDDGLRGWLGQAADTASSKLTLAELEEARKLLETSPLFADVPTAELEATLVQLAPKHFAAGDNIIRVRELADRCYVIRSGHVQVFADDLMGVEEPVRAVNPGEIIGEIALLQDVLRTATVRAVTETDTFVLDRDAFLQLAEAAPLFVRRLQQRAELARRELFLRQASPFAALSDDDITRLAQKLRQVHVQASELVVCQGEPGDCFFLVRSGRLQVVRDGRLVQEMTVGDYFGEAAQLARHLRNATVQALEDSELLALRKPAFLELVQNYPWLYRHFKRMMEARDGGKMVVSTEPLPPGPVSRAPRRPFWLALVLGLGLFIALDEAARLSGLSELGVAALVVGAVVGPVTYLIYLSTIPDKEVLPGLRRVFWATLLTGLVLSIALDEAARVSGRPELAFAVLVVGALVGPVTYVVFLASTNVLTRQPLNLAVTFLIAAAAVLPAAKIELAITAHTSGVLTPLTYAAIEEPVKVLCVVWLLRRREDRFTMDGVIYGAAAGMGFSAFETLNYGFLNMASVSQMLGILWFRAVLSPFTHGTWTAIVCAAIWGVKGSGPVRWNWRILGAFAISIALHTAWDWAPLPVPLTYYYLSIGLIGLAILGFLFRDALREARDAVIDLGLFLIAPGRSTRGAEVICQRCGHTAPAGTRYCPRDGAALRLWPTRAPVGK